MKYFLTLTLLFFSLTLEARPDLTIVGFIQPEDGIGKISMNLLETLEASVSANFRLASPDRFEMQTLPPFTKKAVQNRDQTTGKVALLIDLLSYGENNNALRIPQEAVIKIACSMLETTKIPEKWVEILNNQLDAVVVPDPYLKKVYKKCGVTIPIFVLPLPMILEPFLSQDLYAPKKKQPFVFGDLSAGKNPLPLLNAFAKAFGNNHQVRLLLRAGRFSTDMKQKIDRLVAELCLANVEVQEGYLHLDEYIALLSSLHCFVNLSRGEGFSFIPREALALGVPVIIADNTASKTICRSGAVCPVRSDIKGPANPFYLEFFHEECGEQFDCTLEDITEALQEVYSRYSLYVKKAKQGRLWVQRYDCKNQTLQKRYLNLVRPQNIYLGKKNYISEEGLTTSCESLYQKYMSIKNEEP